MKEEYRVTDLRAPRQVDGGVLITFQGRGKSMSESGLCLFQRGNVIICASCDSPPADSVYLKAAPEGIAAGEYAADDPRLVGGQDGPLPEDGPPEV